jgi:hypothetical protein
MRSVARGVSPWDWEMRKELNFNTVFTAENAFPQSVFGCEDADG